MNGERQVTIRHLAKRLVHAGGLYRHHLARQPFSGVAVLAYHGIRASDMPVGAMAFGALHVTELQIAEHCRTLTRLCSPISLAQWRRARVTGAPLPSCPVLVTFDDGYRSVLTRALPVLERFNVPAVVFACAEPIDRQERLWFDAVAARHGEAAVDDAKRLPYTEWLALARDVRVAATASDLHAPLSGHELQQLARHPLIEIGNHTLRHPILARAPLDDQQREIEEGAGRLAQLIGVRAAAFAYPNGQAHTDYTPDTTALVARSGAIDAFAIAERFASPSQSMEHARFLMLDGISGAELAHRLAWTWRSRQELASA